MFDLTGKVALVTGASSGIGRGIAIALANQGASVAITARRLDKLQSLATEITSQGKKIYPYQLDVLKKENITSVVSKIIETHGRLDILVNNAGVYKETSLETMKEEDWDITLQTNLKAYMVLSKEVMPFMKKQKQGRIINIGSVAMGNQGFGIAGGSAYAASKAAVVGLTESLADELAPYGILVNCIAPGLIESEMTASIVNNPPALKGILSRIPLARTGKPEEIAAGVAFLASDEASYITGSTLIVDGGWLSM